MRKLLLLFLQILASVLVVDSYLIYFLWYRTGSNLVSDIDISTHQLGKQIHFSRSRPDFSACLDKKLCHHRKCKGILYVCVTTINNLFTFYCSEQLCVLYSSINGWWIGKSEVPKSQMFYIFFVHYGHCMRRHGVGHFHGQPHAIACNGNHSGLKPPLLSFLIKISFLHSAGAKTRRI